MKIGQIITIEITEQSCIGGLTYREGDRYQAEYYGPHFFRLPPRLLKDRAVLIPALRAKIVSG